MVQADEFEHCFHLVFPADLVIVFQFSLIKSSFKVISITFCLVQSFALVMVTSLNEQTKDLSSCCVCYTTLLLARRSSPKYLSCSHTFCLKCTKVNLRVESVKYFKFPFKKTWIILHLKEMAYRQPPGQIICPLCDKVCTITAEGSDSLPNNLHALHVVELENELTQRDNIITECDNTISKLSHALKNGQ